MADLQELFSRLKSPEVSASPPPSNPSIWQSQRSTSQLQPSVSSPILSPQANTPNPHHASAIMSPSGTPAPAPDSKAANLLNLLRFNGPPQQSSPLTAMQNVGPTSPVSNPQDFLLGLLNRPKVAEQTKERVSRETTPVRVFGADVKTTPFEAPLSAKKDARFSYINPFEQLSASSPRNPSPQPAPVNGHESVAEALSGVGEQVEKQADRALADAVAKQEQQQQSEVKVKQEPDVADSWESEPPATTEVQVYNFPMRPFVSIVINKTSQASPLRLDSLMDIARLKKEFDQADRTLVAASPSHIVYGLAKNGGFRVIRQDSGRDKQAFKNSQERIINVQVSSAPKTDYILATGVNGSVYWTCLTSEDLEEETLESKGFVMPPIPVQDDNTSGSPVKTRAKMSSRHPEMFGVFRGKSIHIITPMVARSAHYTDKTTRTIDIEKYLGDRALRINTAKAGKDFTFSEDDTVVASLDKAGRIKLWDIRPISDIAKAAIYGKNVGQDLNDPLLTLNVAMHSGKVSPTSVMFVDKERPCVKGIALRYLIVGLKQNHVIQLWDLGLGKPVQELHFPHEKDSDAICSIAYHPKTGIISLAHPTRNSIFFVHLSAPRYHISNMDQAKYITMVASSDPALPKPESTAIMSGIREFSFATKGQLRSIDMLKNPTTTPGDETLFELYAMHSKGVTCVGVKRQDLGWGSDNKVISPVDAEAAGVVSISPIKAADGSVDPLSNEVAEQTTVIIEAPVKDVNLSFVTAESYVLGRKTPSPAPPSLPVIAPAAAPEPTPASVPVLTVPVPTAEVPVPVPAAVEASAIATALELAASAPALSAPTPPLVAPEVLPVRSKAVTPPSEATPSVSSQFDALYRKIDDDRRVQDAAANARQDAVLRLVASTLTDNVEKSLDKIVSNSIQTLVLPALGEMITSTVDKKLASIISGHLGNSVPREIKAGLQKAISGAMQEADIHRTIIEQTGSTVASRIEQGISEVMVSTIIPKFTNLSSSSVEKAVANAEARFSQQIKAIEVARSDDSAKIERLSNLVVSLTGTVQEMAAGQSAFQEQILRQRHDGARSAESHTSDVVQSVEDEELRNITSLMTEGRYEEGTIKWLQSPRQGELFDLLFVRCNPQYLQKLSPLVMLSVSAAITSSFEKNVMERLDWIGIVLANINLKDPEIIQVAPKIMSILQQRMQAAYMAIAEVNPSDPILRLVSQLSRQIGEIRDLTG